jgi:hypothetical protein
MREQVIKLSKWTLKFYYPVGKKQLYGQIYDNITGEVIEDGKIKTQADYDFAIEVITLADNNLINN